MFVPVGPGVPAVTVASKTVATYEAMSPLG